MNAETGEYTDRFARKRNGRGVRGGRSVHAAAALLLAALAATAVPAAVRRVRAAERKKHPHCGGCLMNCDLRNPGCGIGRGKAEKSYGNGAQPRD